MINAERYCKFVRVNSADPCPLELSAVGEPSYCVCCSFMRASRYTSTHIISCLDAPRTFRGTSETPGGFHLLYVPLAETVATTAFMWLPKNSPNRRRYTHWQTVFTGALYCVHTESDSSFSRPKCTPVEPIQALDSIAQTSSVVGVQLNSQLFKWEGTRLSSSVRSYLFLTLYQQLFHRLI